MDPLQGAYDELGVSPNASKQEVKTAYRRLARTYHPDVNKEKDATSKMQDINDAYEKVMGTFESEDESVHEQSQTEDQNTGKESRSNAAPKYQSSGSKDNTSNYQPDEKSWQEPVGDTKEYMNTPGYRFGRNPRGTYGTGETFTASIRSHWGDQDIHNFRFTFRKIMEEQRGDRKRSILRDLVTEIERTNRVSEFDLLMSLIDRAMKLTNLYYDSTSDFGKTIFKAEVRKAFIVVLAILNNVESLSGLDHELQTVKLALNTKEGHELWNSLESKSDLDYRMLVVRALLSGMSIEDISEEFKVNGKEGLKKLELKDFSERVLKLDFTDLSEAQSAA